MKEGGVLEIIGLPSYLLDIRGQPKKILFWEKDNDYVGRLATTYFNVARSIDWSKHQRDINKGAPYIVGDGKSYVGHIISQGGGYKFLSQDKNAADEVVKKYDKAMAPFNEANKRYWGPNWIAKMFKKTVDWFSNKKPIKEVSKKLEKESLKFLEQYFKKFKLQYKEKSIDKYNRDSLIFIKQ